MSRPLSAIALAIASSVPSPPSTSDQIDLRAAARARSATVRVAGRQQRRRLGASTPRRRSRSRSHARARRASRAASTQPRFDGNAYAHFRQLSLKTSPQMHQKFLVAMGAGNRRVDQRRGAPILLQRPRRVTSATTRACTAGSVTRPPLPTSLRPASNCGFTSATIVGRPARRAPAAPGRCGAAR